MKIVYLVQGSLDDLHVILHLLPKNQFLISLNYDKDPGDSNLPSDLHLYFPDSTWASGRNLLLQKAQEQNIAFDYFVFLDADLRVVNGSFHDFEVFLKTYKPKLGLPLGDQIKDTYRFLPDATVETQYSFDQIMQAYRSDIVQESFCLPYTTDFDSDSWWYSCEINSYLSILSCGKEIIQFNDFEIINSRHDGPELELKNLSNYKSGITPIGLSRCRDFIITNHGKQKPLLGTLFHPRFLPQVILFPTFGQLIADSFNENRSITPGRLFLSGKKTIQNFMYKTVFRRYHLGNRKIF